MKIRHINKNDYNHGHLQLYKQLTTINPDQITQKNYETFIDSLNENHCVFVLFDETINKILGSATVLIEQKLIHNMGKVGHVEDVVVDSDIRGKGIGKLLISHVVDYCKEKNCYKVILDCADNNIAFYEKCGFIKKGNEMAKYF